MSRGRQTSTHAARRKRQLEIASNRNNPYAGSATQRAASKSIYPHSGPGPSRSVSHYDLENHTVNWFRERGCDGIKQTIDDIKINLEYWENLRQHILIMPEQRRSAFRVATHSLADKQVPNNICRITCMYQFRLHSTSKDGIERRRICYISEIL